MNSTVYKANICIILYIYFVCINCLSIIIFQMSIALTRNKSYNWIKIIHRGGEDIGNNIATKTRTHKVIQISIPKWQYFSFFLDHTRYLSNLYFPLRCSTLSLCFILFVIYIPFSLKFIEVLLEINRMVFS